MLDIVELELSSTDRSSVSRTDRIFDLANLDLYGMHILDPIPVVENNL